MVGTFPLFSLGGEKHPNSSVFLCSASLRLWHAFQQELACPALSPPSCALWRQRCLAGFVLALCHLSPPSPLLRERGEGGLGGLLGGDILPHVQCMRVRVQAYGPLCKFLSSAFVAVITLIDTEKTQMHAAVII